jgi:hypothetical protein
VTRFNVAACVSLAIFAVACADSATGVHSLSGAPASAAFAGNPPPPPLTGDDGSGRLEPFGEESEFAASARGVQTTRSNTAPTNSTCDLPSGKNIHYSWDYLENKNDNNQWAHLDIDDQNRKVSIHQTNKKLDASGEIVGNGYTFKITGVSSGSFDRFGFDLTITGTLTRSDGTTCQATADLFGTLSGED